MGRGPRAGEEAEGAMAETQPLLESEVGAGQDEEEKEEELGTPAQRPEPMDGSG